MSTSILLLGVLFGSLGFGYLLYGWKQRRLLPLACGAVLVIAPYFIPNALALFVLGGIVCVVPWVLRS